MDCRWGRSNADAVAAAVRGGATLVQVREKDADGGAFLREARSTLCFVQCHLLFDSRFLMQSWCAFVVGLAAALP